MKNKIVAQKKSQVIKENKKLRKRVKQLEQLVKALTKKKVKKGVSINSFGEKLGKSNWFLLTSKIQKHIDFEALDMTADQKGALRYSEEGLPILLPHLAKMLGVEPTRIVLPTYDESGFIAEKYGVYINKFGMTNVLFIGDRGGSDRMSLSNYWSGNLDDSLYKRSTAGAYPVSYTYNGFYPESIDNIQTTALVIMVE
jgi:hypothetical protein